MPTLRSVLSLVGLCLAALCGQAGELEERNAISAEFAEAFERSDFAVIESRYARAVTTQKRLGSGQFVANQMVRYMFALRQAKPAQGPSPAKPERGDDRYWNDVEEKTRAWAAQFPKSVLPALALSRAHEQHAWAHRRSGYASTVTPDGWKQFAANINLAHQALLKRADIGRADPNWWYQMLMLGWVQSWPEESYWQVANAAMNAFPQNPDVYSAISRKLLPQWGGSWAAVAAFAEMPWSARGLCKANRSMPGSTGICRAISSPASWQETRSTGPGYAPASMIWLHATRTAGTSTISPVFPAMPATRPRPSACSRG
jgi:hypothetical protein